MNCANHPDRERIAFCQNCGKPLCQECARTVGSAVFCEPCLAAKLSGVGAPPPVSGTYTYTGSEGGLNYSVSGTIPPPHPPGGPNPGLAALLGIIPGVGAMYNGQFAKGIVHLVIFAILVSLSDDHGIFGLFVAGWVCYQVIEAYHTARARRDGTPLPNPFGLNDLGERLGFGKSWAAGTATTSTPAPDVSGPPPAASNVPPPAQGYSYTPPPQGTSWGGAPWDTYTQPGANPYVAPIAADPAASYPRNRFPVGAIWLIGLGALFLIGNSGIIHGFPVQRIFPLFLIGLGVWLFIHKMSLTGALSDDGTPLYRIRLFSALRGSIWVMLVGVMFLLANFNILSWGRSWPLFIIVAGLMTIFEKVTYSSAPPPAPIYPPPSQPFTPPAAPANPIVPPTTPHDQEGR